MTAQTATNLSNSAAQISGLTAAWLKAKTVLEEAKETELKLRNELFSLAFDPGLVGTENYSLGNGYKLKGVGKINHNLAPKEDTSAALDALEALGAEGKFIAERIVAWKPTLSVSEYKKLASDSPYKRIIDGVLTTSPATPTLELVEPKAKK